MYCQDAVFMSSTVAVYETSCYLKNGFGAVADKVSGDGGLIRNSDVTGFGCLNISHRLLGGIETRSDASSAVKLGVGGSDAQIDEPDRER